ncbi:MAG: 3-isopropylmalate dehydratase large subunit [Candidatus Coatesbacteria bacterium]|nr:3-isopropylmalate dehydratase large subunit [Candidatus Coatesbacteria bacterium]
MGQSVIQQILSRHSDQKPVVGDIIWMNIDLRTARDFGGPNVVENLEHYFENNKKVDDISKTYFTFDTVAPAKNIGYADNQHKCRMFAWKEGIKIFDVDQGIGTHIMLEKGYVGPGYTAVGTDSHYNILGAICAFGQGMGDQDIALAFRAGRVWYEVPPSMLVSIKGKPRELFSAKDLTLKVLGRLGAKGALGRCIEYKGEPVDKLDLPGRITLASMATEMGAISSFIIPDEGVLEFCKKRMGKLPSFIPEMEENVDYIEKIEIDINDCIPQISRPNHPEDVVSIDEAAGAKIHSVFIGSCTNGRFEDFEAAARLLEKHKVEQSVMCRLVPSTREVYGQLLESGLLRKFYEAGAIISNPGCGGCASGQIGMTGTGEVQISTSNRNFKGKQGNGLTYLASPLIAAACAIKGEIVDYKTLLNMM